MRCKFLNNALLLYNKKGYLFADPLQLVQVSLPGVVIHSLGTAALDQSDLEFSHFYIIIYIYIHTYICIYIYIYIYDIKMTKIDEEYV